ncbi:hypothetical protein KR054_004260 [Drosophila jambulina]|nr:hypothetical protein KR054_004260 [Drosophila jambulina]
MQNFGTSLLWALAVCSLWQGSLAEDRQSGYVCLLDDQDPNQCDSFCLTELRPLLNQVIKGQDRRNTCDEAALKVHLQGMEAQLREMQAKVDTKLESSLFAVRTKLEDQQAVLTKMENKLQAILNKLEEAGKFPVLDRNNITSGFEQIGTRYFRVVKELADWATANRRCGKMGGYLAAFQNRKELEAFAAKHVGIYWQGINDRKTVGQYISVASQKPAQILNWIEKEPTDSTHQYNCVALISDIMQETDCSKKFNFICQADNET